MYSFIMTCVLAFNSLVSANQGDETPKILPTSNQTAVAEENDDEDVVIQVEDENEEQKTA